MTERGGWAGRPDLQNFAPKKDCQNLGVHLSGNCSLAACLCKHLRLTMLLRGAFCVELARFCVLCFAFSRSKKTAISPLLLACLYTACVVRAWTCLGMLGMPGVLAAQPLCGMLGMPGMLGMLLLGLFFSCEQWLQKDALILASFFSARRSLAIAFGLRALASSVGNFGVCRMSVF